MKSVAAEWAKFKTPTVVLAAKLSAAVVLLAAVSTLVYNSLEIWDRMFPSSAISSAGESTGATTPATTPATTNSSAVAAPAVPVVGACIEEGREVGCESAHEYQIISGVGEPCGVDELLSYVGGAAGVDSVAPNLAASSLTIQGVSVCVVPVVSSAEYGSLRDALLTARGDSIRWCIDLAGRDSGCASLHSAEVVYSDNRAGVGVTCDRKFQEYVESTDSQLLLDVKVEPKRSGDSFRCLAAVRGEYALEGSLRRLGDNSLPIREL